MGAAIHDRVTKEGAGTATLYVNGVAVPSVAVAARSWNATGQFTVGRALRNDANTEYFAGDIDDVYAYQEVFDTDDVGNLMRKDGPQG